jgi:indolepyruvate ferredoxin oxidoreductase
MTGGQVAAGAVPVPDLTRQLEAEGVRRILVLTDEPGRYPRDARWAPGVEVWSRDRLDEAQRLLRDVPGVTALVYDQRCAAEKRRLRKRGQLPDPATRIVINEAVCEGCGDCGVKSNCLSVQPVETELGRKTRIHQSSCNKDYSCLLGDCPSFLSVEPMGARARRPRRGFEVQGELVAPARRVRLPASLVLTGIGGTGVVTVNQLLGTAALLDGRHVSGLDQTGLSQKGGPVVSHLRIADSARDGAGKVGVAEADCYLAFDLLVATAPANLARARPDLTIAVVSTSRTPTGAMVASRGAAFPDPAGLVAAVNRVSRKDENVFVDATRLAEALFGDHMAANMILLGAAYQAGAIPVTAAAIERAIALNEVAVEANTQAFRAGRVAAADPSWVATVLGPRVGARTEAPALTGEVRALVDRVGAEGELRRLLEHRVPELVAYQDSTYAGRYVAFVRQVAEAERAAVPGETRLAEAVARHLFTLMACKDEYEVARLHLRPEMAASLEAAFGGPVRVRYHLHPPVLRALGWTRKIAVGRWIEPMFRLLVVLRRLRGGALDPFGHTALRRLERALPGEYRAMVERALAGLSPQTHARAVEIARLPELVRGYEGVKRRAVERFREEARRLGAAP